MPLTLSDVVLKAIVREADKLGLNDDAGVSIGVWTHVPHDELSIFNMPQFQAVIQIYLGEVRSAITPAKEMSNE